MMPFGLSGGDQVSIIMREDKTVANGAGCSEGTEKVKERRYILAIEKEIGTGYRNFENGIKY